MFSGNAFTFGNVGNVYIPEKYQSQGQTDPNTLAWPELLVYCSTQCSVLCMSEFNVLGYIFFFVIL